MDNQTAIKKINGSDIAETWNAEQVRQRIEQMCTELEGERALLEQKLEHHIQQALSRVAAHEQIRALFQRVTAAERKLAALTREEPPE